MSVTDLTSAAHDAPLSASRAHAVIIGSSIAALCAAEVLARSFERVTLVERDTLPSTAEPRRGVPQSNQPHGVLARGRAELEALFPGLIRGLLQEGAVEFDASLQAARYMPKGWAPRYQGLYTAAFACTRPLLELHMRQRLLARRGNVRVVEGTRVTDLVTDTRDGQAWVHGVRTDAVDPTLAVLHADLVVDASGRGTKAFKWMTQLGLPEPEELRVDARGNYATRLYRAPEEAKNWFWRSVLIDNDAPSCRRACAILTVEGSRWMVTASGINGDYAPTDEAGWLAFIESTRSPAVFDLLSRAQPLGDVVQSRTTMNRWRQMHRYDAPLHGLLLFGDAVCSFNPIYGQGITGSALGAAALARELERHQGAFDSTFARRCYAAQAGFQQEGWSFSTTLDLRWPGTKGRRSWLSSLLGRTADKLQEVAIHDPRLLKRLIPFSDFGARRISLLAPAFLLGAAVGLVRQQLYKPQLEQEIDLFEPIDQVLVQGKPASELGALRPASG